MFTGMWWMIVMCLSSILFHWLWPWPVIVYLWLKYVSDNQGGFNIFCVFSHWWIQPYIVNRSECISSYRQLRVFKKLRSFHSHPHYHFKSIRMLGLIVINKIYRYVPVYRDEIPGQHHSSMLSVQLYFCLQFETFFKQPEFDGNIGKQFWKVFQTWLFCE